MKEFIKPYSNQPFRFWMGPLLIVASDNPDDLQIITNSPNSINKDMTYRLFEKYFDVFVPGLIAANGDLWKNHRKLLNPCFAKKILDTYTPIFNKTSRVMIEVMEHHVADGGAFNVEQYIHRCSLDQIVGMKIRIISNYRLW
jgi:cytochrome P450